MAENEEDIIFSVKKQIRRLLFSLEEFYDKYVTKIAKIENSKNLENPEWDIKDELLEFNFNVGHEVDNFKTKVYDSFIKNTKFTAVRSLFLDQSNILLKIKNESLQPKYKIKHLKNRLNLFIEDAMKKRWKIEGTHIDEEIVEKKLKNIEKFIIKNGKNPSPSANNSKERRLAKEMYKLNEIQKKSPMVNVKNKIRETFHVKSLEEKIDEYLDFYKKNSMAPSLKSDDETEVRLARFRYNQQRISSTRKKPLPSHLNRKFDEMIFISGLI